MIDQINDLNQFSKYQVAIGFWVKTSESKFYIIVLLYTFYFWRAGATRLVLAIMVCSGSSGFYKTCMFQKICTSMFDLEKLSFHFLLAE